MTKSDLVMARILAALETTDDESTLRQVLDPEALSLYMSIKSIEDSLKSNIDLSQEIEAIEVDKLIRKASLLVASCSEAPVSYPKCDAIQRQPLDGFTLVDRIGEGGSSTVYQAINLSDNQKVAVKVLRQEVDEVTTSRFRREWRIISTLKCPQIVRAHQLKVIDKQYFIVMDYVEGTTLREIVTRLGPLDIERTCNILNQTAIGLQMAHSAGIVHRDLKPNNLMLNGSDQVKILDFGLASMRNLPDDSTLAEPFTTSLTGSNTLLGTIEYSSPEQLMDPKRVDHRADLYSLGCIAYFLATGQPPFPRSRFPALSDRIFAQLQNKPTPIWEHRKDLTEDIVNAIEQLLAKDPDDRKITLDDIVSLTGGN